MDVADDAVYLDTDGSLNHPAAGNKHHLALSTHAYRLTQRVHMCVHERSYPCKAVDERPGRRRR